MAEKKETKNCHAGHRERMRQNVMRHGFDSLHDHELLELLLFYALPRCNTNELAHRLIETFGSLQNVFNADLEKLKLVDGMGETSAVLIKTVLEAIRRYVMVPNEKLYLFDSSEKVVRYLRGNFSGKTIEEAYVMLFDNKMKMLDMRRIAIGTINSIQVHFASICRAIFEKNAAAVILAHNHPYGDASPSLEDLALTQQLMNFLAEIEIPLLEHYVIAEESAYPIIHFSRNNGMVYQQNKTFDKIFYSNFFRPTPLARFPEFS